MAEYLLTPRALDDLNEIWNYTVEKWSEEQADKYYGMLVDLFEKLVEEPDLGRRYDIVQPGLLGMKVGRHVIFYRHKRAGVIEIIRILHEEMDLENRLDDPA